ncbi:MAG: DUF5615 family PIN-like protein [Planctomycetota bacterium]
MKLLADTCVSRDAVVEWVRAGHEVFSAADLEHDPGDEELLRRAHEEARVVLTLDRDFGTLAVLRRIPHHGIVRMVGFRAREQGSAGLVALAMHAEELAQGSIVTVERERIRVRLPEQ